MQLQILGRLDLMAPAGGPVADVARQTRLLLACLALAGAKGLTRSELCALFWPDRPTAQARNSLRQSLAAIRKALSGGAATMSLDSDLEIVRLLAAPSSVDVHTFRLGVEQNDRNDRNDRIAAAHAYQGVLLAGVQAPDEVEQFLAAHRHSLNDQAQGLAERLSKADGADDEALDAAQGLADRLLQANPAAEEAHRALIRIHLLRGRTNAALRQFEHCKAALRRDLQAEPEEETRRLVEVVHAAIVEAPADAQRAEQGGPAPRVTAARPSIAVMPFDNLGDAADEYFADGVVEEITSALSRIRDFFVIARQSAFSFRGRFVDVRTVGQALGVAYVVEGTVRRGGDRLRISVQLVDAVARTQLWSDRYEGAASEIFAFQDQIAAQVAGALNPAIRHAEIEAAMRKPPSSLKAYDLVMRAFPKLWGQNATAINEAIPILKSAIGIDPKYGRAHALLAWCHALNATYLWVAEPEREVEAARRAAEAARGRIDDDPTALTAIGAAIGFCGDQEGADALLEQALALDPNNSWAWGRWGWTGIYRAQPDRALQRFDKALQLSPLDPFAFNTRIGMASALAALGSPQKSVAIAKDVIKKHPEVTWAYRLLAAWAAMAGDLATARSAARKLLATNPAFTIRQYLAIPGFQDMSEYHARLAQGLREAGVPEG